MAQAPTSPTPEAVVLARQVLTAMEAEKGLVAGVENALPAQRRLQPSIPAIFWDSVAAQLERRAPEVLDSLAPVYAGQFSVVQLKDLLVFYQSPTGHRLAAVQTDLVSTIGAIAQRWGGRIAIDVMKQLIDQGVTFGDQ